MRSTVTRFALASAAAFGGLVIVASSAPAGASGKATTVTAVETDFHIALSKKTFSPGTYIFVVKNKGQTTHALAITGPGLKNATTGDFSPGKSARLKVIFKKGKYDIYCPVPGHKALGMNMNINVGSGTSITTSGAHTTMG
jgi:uncharacterized cupredoxin-like copper-binding protein